MKKILFPLLITLLFFNFSFIGNARASYYRFYQSDYLVELPEEYKELYDILPTGVYCGKRVEFDNLASSVGGKAFFRWFFLRLITEEILTLPEEPSASNTMEENPNAPRFSRELICTEFEKLYGIGSFSQLEDTEVLTDWKNYLRYDSSTDEYAYIYYEPGTGGDAAQYPYYKYKSVDKKDGEVSLYVYYAVYSRACPEREFYIYGSDALNGDVTSPDRMVLIHATQQSKYGMEGHTLLSSGALDEYLPVYKHTFKDNGQGGYYWFSSEMVEQGSPIPEELFPPMENPEKNPPSTDGNHTILGGNWGSITQPSTETQTPSDDTQTPEPSDDSAPLWGAIVGWGAVAVALAVGIGLVVKRYKK